MVDNYKQFTEVAELLKVIAHPVRICIIIGLMENGERNVTEMQNCLGTPQSTVSQHLQKLKAAGIIEGERKGLEINYHLSNPRIAELLKVLLDNKDL